MKIADVLAAKDRGREVVSIAPDAGVRDLLALLAEHNVGAVVVTSDVSFKKARGTTYPMLVGERKTFLMSSGAVPSQPGPARR